MSWNTDAIYKEQREMLEARFSDGDPALLDELARCRTALYPFALVLGAIESGEAKYPVWYTSKLFPSTFNTPPGMVPVYDPAEKRIVHIRTPTDSELADVDYGERDSLPIANGTQLADDFVLMQGHQAVPYAYINHGTITMVDVRRASQLMFPRNEPPETA